jgi:hypothetical protein
LKPLLLALGSLATILIIAQLVMGQLIVSGHVRLVKAHQHSGYLTVVVSLIYIAMSLPRIATSPRS